MHKVSLIIAEDSNGNLSVPVIDRDKNAVLSMLPEILRQGYVAAHYVKNPSVRTFRSKAPKVHPLIEAELPDDEQDDVAEALSDSPKRRGRPPKSIL